ncbi:MAG: hypothetical protein U1E26_12550 [Coriobacteriia bacterium]|nr:hypothetical protein [Coriobacteriia bacterium]
MKVTTARLTVRALASAVIAAAVLATALLSGPASAQAITRSTILARSKTWIVKQIPYSQHRYYRGYRQDCSGFVSMAWGLKRSYTSRNISSVARRIPVSKLKPGDAVWKPGHVSIFGGWKNKQKRQYYALEQTTWGSHAKRRVRTIPSRGKALRYKGVRTPVRRVAAKPTPAPVAAVPSSESSGVVSAASASLAR